MQFGSYKGITLLLMVLQGSELSNVVSDILASKTDESMRVASNLIDEGYNLLETGAIWEYTSNFNIAFGDKRLISELSYDDFRDYLGAVLVKAMRDDYQNYHKFADFDRVLNTVETFANQENLTVGKGQYKVKEFILNNIEPVSANNSTVCALYNVSYVLPNTATGCDGHTLVDLSEPTKVILERIRDKFTDIEQLVINLQAAADSTRSVNVHNFVDFDRMVLNKINLSMSSNKDAFMSMLAYLKDLCSSHSSGTIECPTASTRELLKILMDPGQFDTVCDELYELGCYGLCDKSAEYYKEHYTDSALSVNISDFASEQSIALLNSLMPIGEVI